MLKNVETGREFITTSQAAQRSNLTKAYLTYLLRKGTLEGFQLSREWFIYTDSLETFLATPRKSGPKVHVTCPNKRILTPQQYTPSKKQRLSPNGTRELFANAVLHDALALPPEMK
jgi:hypothetical protein